MKTLEVYYAYILNQKMRELHYLIFNSTPKEKIFLKAAKDVKELEGIIESERHFGKSREIRDLNVEFPDKKGFYYDKETKTNYEYWKINRYGGQKIRNKFSIYSKK